MSQKASHYVQDFCTFIYYLIYFPPSQPFLTVPYNFWIEVSKTVSYKEHHLWFFRQKHKTKFHLPSINISNPLLHSLSNVLELHDTPLVHWNSLVKITSWLRKGSHLPHGGKLLLPSPADPPAENWGQDSTWTEPSSSRGDPHFLLEKVSGNIHDLHFTSCSRIHFNG